MKIFETKPLELRKKDIKLWEQTGDVCIAVLDDEKSIIKETVLSYSIELYRKLGNAFIVIWSFSDIDSQSIYSDYFKLLPLVFKNETCLVYSLEKESEFQRIVEHWGEYDSLDILFTKDREKYMDTFDIDIYKNYNRYDNAFITRTKNFDAIISDSGDGEEFQLILSKNIREKIEIPLQLHEKNAE